LWEVGRGFRRPEAAPAVPMNLRRATWAFIVLLLTVAPASAAAPQQKRIEVHTLTFHGVKQIEQDDLKGALATRTSRHLPLIGRKAYFDRATFEADLKRVHAYYVDHGFPDARVKSYDVTLNRAQTAVDLTIDVEEGQPILVDTITFTGFGDLIDADRKALRAQATLKQGERLDRSNMEATRQTAANLLKERGYPYGQVSASEQSAGDPHHIRIEFTASPGVKAYFGDIQIAGNKSVSDNIVRRELLFHAGDLFRRSAVRQSQRKLYDMELFQFANIEVVNPDQQNTQVPTRVTVAEGKPRRVNFSVGYGTEEEARGEVQWHHYNFFGGARTAGVHAKWSSLDRGVQLDFNEPYFFSPYLSLGVDAHQWYDIEPAYRVTSSGVRLAANFRAVRQITWSLGYVNEFESSRISDAALNDLTLRDQLIALGLNPLTGVQDGTVSAFSLEVQRNTADNPLNATKGTYLSAHVEQAAHFLRGTFQYTSLSLEGRDFLSFGPHIVLATRLHYGTIRPAGNVESEVPFFKRYFLGGAETLRGWGRYEVSPLSESGLPLGGFTLFQGTAELRFRLTPKIGAVGFLDAGNVWAGSWRVDGRDVRYDIGPGFRYSTPIGPLRVDLGYQLNPIAGLLVNGKPESRHWRLHFSIGQAF
jgi:outer membrane protein insertion porin family/translocation and assembly module TamA